MLHPDWTSPEMRECPPFCNEGLPMCHLGGDTPSSSRNAFRQQFLSGRCGVSNGLTAYVKPLMGGAL